MFMSAIPFRIFFVSVLYYKKIELHPKLYENTLLFNCIVRLCLHTATKPVMSLISKDILGNYIIYYNNEQPSDKAVPDEDLSVIG